MPVLNDFFRLNPNGGMLVLADGPALIAHFRNSRSLQHAIVTPGAEVARGKFKDYTFENVALSHLTFHETTFTNCTFQDCLLIGAVFIDCEFHRCHFNNCNTYKLRLEKIYIDPDSFSFAKQYCSTASNVGVDLFQTLYENSMSTHQSLFASSADVERRRWRRYQWWYDFRKRNAPRSILWQIAKNLTFDVTAKYGYSPVRFMGLSALLFLLISWFTKTYWTCMGVSRAGTPIEQVSYLDSLYYSMLLVTTLGFSDLMPSTNSGKLFAIFCAVFGISWMALFTAILIRRVIR
jgi:hypothetical protein